MKTDSTSSNTHKIHADKRQAGTQTANINANKTNGNVPSGKVDTAALLYISMSFGFSLVVNAWVFFRISGGLFNPAVSYPAPTQLRGERKRREEESGS